MSTLKRTPATLGAMVGRAAARLTATGAARTPDLSGYWRRQLADITPGEFAFTLDLIRGAGAANVNLDELVEQFEWSDEDAALSGAVTLRYPNVAGEQTMLPVAAGYQVRCRVNLGAALYELWTMVADWPTDQWDAGQKTIPLKDDMSRVVRSRKHFLYRSTKHRPHGYFGHEALRLAAKQEGIKIGQLAKCSKRMAKIDVTGSFLDLAVKVYEHEHTLTGLKFLLRFRNGRFEAVHYERNSVLYVLHQQLRSAMLTDVPKHPNPRTVITGTARLGTGKGAKKIKHTEYDRAVVRRWGYFHENKSYGHVQSHGELKAKVRRDLAENLAVNHTGTVQTQGIPFIRRGDAVQILVDGTPLKGDRSYVFATAVRHQVDGSSFTTEVDYTSHDPFLTYKAAREKAARDAAKKKKKAKKT